MTEKTEVNSLEDALRLLDARFGETVMALELFRTNTKELIMQLIDYINKSENSKKKKAKKA